MLTVDQLLSIEKDDLPEASKSFTKEDLNTLVGWLSEKDDKTRYQALQILQKRAELTSDTYSYWEVFCEKLKDTNSYQRSIGLIMIAENARWDVEDRLKQIINEYLFLINDDKPITVRICLQNLCRIIPYKPELHEIISKKLMEFDVSKVRESMRKLVLSDILSVLALIRKSSKNDEIESYIFKALASGMLDKKAVKQIESML